MNVEWACRVYVSFQCGGSNLFGRFHSYHNRNKCHIEIIKTNDIQKQNSSVLKTKYGSGHK